LIIWLLLVAVLVAVVVLVAAVLAERLEAPLFFQQEQSIHSLLEVVALVVVMVAILHL
jgi:hypothetical protein